MYYEVFKELCSQNNVTPAEVSRKTGIAQATLSNWKKGNYTPKADKLQKIADYFGVPIDSFLGVETNEHQNGYYINEEAAKVAQQIFDNRDMRILFDAAQNSKPEDLKMAADLLARLKGTNPDA